MTIGSGNKITETRAVSGFDRIDLYGVGKLIVRQTGVQSLTIEGDDNIVPLVRAEVTGQTLRIGLEPGMGIQPWVPLVFNVTVSDLSALHLSGAGSIEGDDLRAGNFEAGISGAGNARLGNLTADSLKVSISGAGDFVLSGNVTEQEVVLSGAGSYRAGDLQSRSASVRTTGAGSATVRVSDNLSASLSGVGSVRYYGSPVVQQHKSGLGNITRIGD
jgi:Putative auto-transporter adhesin, head GIN domain